MLNRRNCLVYTVVGMGLFASLFTGAASQAAPGVPEVRTIANGATSVNFVEGQSAGIPNFLTSGFQVGGSSFTLAGFDAVLYTDLFTAGGDTYFADFALFSDSGTQLTSWTTETTSLQSNTPQRVELAYSGAPLILQANTRYSLGVRPSSSLGNVYWVTGEPATNNGINGVADTSPGNQSAPLFGVYGVSAAPEASSLALLAVFGSGALMGKTLRRRNR